MAASPVLTTVTAATAVTSLAALALGGALATGLVGPDTPPLPQDLDAASMPRVTAPYAPMPHAHTPWSPDRAPLPGGDAVIRTASIPVTAIIPPRPARAAYAWSISTVEDAGTRTVTHFVVD